MFDASRLKAPTMLATIIGVAWVLADAMNVGLPTDPPLPSMEALLTDPPRAKAMLRATAVYDLDAAHLIAACLLQKNADVRQAARSVAHERLDLWQLDTPAKQQRMATWLSGSLRRLLEPPSQMTLTAEGKEVAERLLRIATRQAFVDGNTCVDDCRFVCSTAPKKPASVLNAHPLLKEQLKQSLVAPASYQE